MTFHWFSWLYCWYKEKRFIYPILLYAACFCSLLLNVQLICFNFSGCDCFMFLRVFPYLPSSRIVSICFFHFSIRDFIVGFFFHCSVCCSCCRQYIWPISRVILKCVLVHCTYNYPELKSMVGTSSRRDSKYITRLVPLIFSPFSIGTKNACLLM